VAGRGLLVVGPAGAGKSALALELISRGAALVADDRTVLAPTADGVCAAPPAAIAGLIEARGLGLLRLPHSGAVPVAAIADLGAEEAERLPPRRTTALLGRPVALYRRPRGVPFAAALFLALTGAVLDPDAPPDPARGAAPDP
jgi:HPr kinase/phosphorylase